jgi:anion-transporting  ArsA/GET3 family ATPase
MSGLFDNFHTRIERAYEVLRGPTTAFVLVSSPEEQVLDDAEYLSTKMEELEMALKGVVLNRVHEELRAEGRRADDLGPEEIEEITELVAEALGPSAAEAPALAANFADYQVLARGECLRIEQFKTALGDDVPLVHVPNFTRDVHDLGTLAEMHRHLFAAGQ